MTFAAAVHLHLSDLIKRKFSTFSAKHLYLSFTLKRAHDTTLVINDSNQFTHIHYSSSLIIKKSKILYQQNETIEFNQFTSNNSMHTAIFKCLKCLFTRVFTIRKSAQNVFRWSRLEGQDIALPLSLQFQICFRAFETLPLIQALDKSIRGDTVEMFLDLTIVFIYVWNWHLPKTFLKYWRKCGSNILALRISKTYFQLGCKNWWCTRYSNN